MMKATLMNQIASLFSKKRLSLGFLSIFCAVLILLTNCQHQFGNIVNIHSGSGKQIIVLGDSITAGYGLEKSQAYPSLLAQKLNLPILNRGVSGDTTANGLQRLETDVLDESPWLVIVALGGNDFLKKVPKTTTEQNLRSIITKIQAQNAIAVILGMNLGLFKDEYRDLYQSIATDTGSFLIPQVLKNIIDNPKHRQQDIIHPNAIGQEILATRIAKDLQPLIEAATLPGQLKR
jgi:acyl-CoA thioesterase I